MKFNKNIKFVLKRVIMVGSLFVCISFFAWFMQHYVMTRLDVHQRRVEGFYMEEKNSLDMVLVGSSEIYNGFVPAIAWEDYGISSYLYGYQSDPASLWSYQLKEIERTQNPDLVVIECNGAVYDEEDLNNPAEVRFMTDDMPLSRNKIQLINEKATETKLSYYFPILKYHSHLIPESGTSSKILLEKRGFNIMHGAQARIDSVPIKKKKRIDVEGDDSKQDLNPASERALRGFLEQCKESDVHNIVFVRFPHVVVKRNYDRFQRYHRIGEIVEEYGFDYIDFDDYKDDMGIVVKKDFLDCEHLNADGARKMTEFAVPFLMDKYHIVPKKHSKKVTKRWEESVDYYNRLYEYWRYFEETYPDETDDKYDLNDGAYSKKYIDAYFAGHPIKPGTEKEPIVKRMKELGKRFIH